MMSAENKGNDLLPGIFAGLFGLLLGLSMVKFGNPVVLEKMIEWPTNVFEWIFNPWPVVIAYWLLGGVVVVGLLVAQWRTGASRVVAALPLVWLGWEILAGTQTVSDQLTRPTLIHFATCVVCFYLGLFSLGRVRNTGPFWAGILTGFFIALLSGLQQHFGGLEESRRYFYLYNTNLAAVPPDLLKKMSSNRIFGTLFYPNALAGVILLLLPATLAVFWSMNKWLTAGARLFLMTVAGLSALACLYWSGSKGGWLLLLVIGFVGILFLPFKRQYKLRADRRRACSRLGWLFCEIFGVLQARRPQRRGAVRLLAGGFANSEGEAALWDRSEHLCHCLYEKLKKPESEMARLTHNDYLQQASDSGMMGFWLMHRPDIWVSQLYLPIRQIAGKLAETGRVARGSGMGFAKFGRIRPVYSGPGLAGIFPYGLASGAKFKTNRHEAPHWLNSALQDEYTVSKWSKP